MNAPIIQLDRVSVRYSRGMPWARTYVEAAREASLSIAERATLGLVGESGSGKSTLGKVCLGLFRPTSGRAVLSGEPIFGIGRRRPGTLAAVLQHPEWSFNPKLTIGRSIAEPLRITGIKRDEKTRIVAAILERVGLGEGLASHLPHELSGGQRQRASIARALVTTPKFVVFDEAVSALDVSIQAQILNCQWRSKKGPPWRCKKGPLGGCGFVPVVHGRAPRATRRALNRPTRRRAREGPVGPRGQAWAGWSVQLAVGV